LSACGIPTPNGFGSSRNSASIRIKCSAFEGEIKGRGFESGVRYIAKPVRPGDIGNRSYLRHG
jgi:hypothetical protein